MPTSGCVFLRVLQILGAISGAALVAALTPADVYVSMGDGGPGCFDVKGAVNSNITKSQVFGWEVSVLTIVTCRFNCGHG
jgi:hypothetical protein